MNNAAGSVETKDGAAFVDLDAVPKDGISFKDGLKFLLSDKAESLRNLLEDEVDSIVDILSRQIFRQGISEATVALTPPRPPALPFLGDFLPQSPKLDEIPLPILLPSPDGTSRPTVAITTIKDLTDALAPKLSQEDEIYALGLSDAATEFFGDDVGSFVKGDSLLSVKSVELLLGALRSGVVGRSDVLSSETVDAVIDSISNIVSLVRGSNADTTTVEKELTEAIDSLDENERKRLDDIVQELTRRTISRAVKRLSSIERVL